MAHTVTLVIPCYNEEQSLGPLYQALCGVMGDMETRFGAAFELLFVDDGSRDATLAGLRALAARDSRVRYLSFSRNFGKEAAIYAGLERSSGDLIALIDADLQHPPALLAQMYTAITEQGYDRMAARRSSRKGEPRLRSLFAGAFYKVIRRLTGMDLVDGATDYCMMTRQVAAAILALGEYNRFTKGINAWVGFRTGWIPYENVERAAGETKWSFWKLLRYSLDGILSFSTAPLAVASVAGILLCLAALAIIVAVVVKTLLYGDPVAGFPTLICAVCFIGGVQLFCLGILGQYMARMYLEVKRRPLYLVREESGE